MARYSFRHRPIIGIFVCIALLSGTCLAGLIGVVALRRFRLTHLGPGVTRDHFGGRELLVYAPASLPTAGSRALVVVLHGGLGNASMIEGGLGERGLKLDAVAEKNGFLVAYLNGTKVARLLGQNRLGWNAGGGCCGLPAQEDVDDVGYITRTVNYLTGKYGIDPKRVFGIGHSNGAMMTLRMMCETSVFQAAISVSGPLNLDGHAFSKLKGKRILSIHGANDENVPVAGGRGSKGISGVDYKSEEYTQKVMRDSGADFRLQIVPGADHMLERIDKRIKDTEGVTLAEKAARFFGLAQPTVSSIRSSQTSSLKK